MKFLFSEREENKANMITMNFRCIIRQTSIPLLTHFTSYSLLLSPLILSSTSLCLHDCTSILYLSQSSHFPLYQAPHFMLLSTVVIHSLYIYISQINLSIYIFTIFSIFMISSFSVLYFCSIFPISHE